MKPTISRTATLVVSLALLVTAVAASPSPADDRTARTGEVPLKTITTRIAPGLTLTRIIDKKTPRRIFVLTVNISTPLTMDVALAGPQMPVRALTSDIAKRNGAIAAVNGDFGSRTGWTTHPFEQDGALIRTSSDAGILFAVSKDEQHVIFGQPAQLVTATDPTGLTWTIDHWNDGPPAVGEISAFSPVGGTLEAPPPATCSARLLPAGPITPSTAGTGMEQAYTVEQHGCFLARMPTDGGVILSAQPASDEALQLLSLVSGSIVTLRWTFGWANVWDAIGGVPLLLANGQDVVGLCASSLCGRNPRTGVGVTADGRILLVVVDGRRSGYSVGATLHEFATIFEKLGATYALNLDGGGSSTMVVKGAVVNRPSDGFQRRVSTALLVLPGPDPREPSA